MSDELRQMAETIIGCTTRIENKFGVQYERDESKFCFGLKEPYELAHAYLREHELLNLIASKCEVRRGEPYTFVVDESGSFVDFVEVDHG